MVDPSGFEPEASCLQSRRSSRLIYGPVIKESKKGDDKDNGQIIFFQSGHSRAEHTANYCPIIHYDFPIRQPFLHLGP